MDYYNNQLTFNFVSNPNLRRGYKTSRDLRREVKIMRQTLFKHKALLRFERNRRKSCQKLKVY